MEVRSHREKRKRVHTSRTQVGKGKRGTRGVKGRKKKTRNAQEEGGRKGKE